MAHVGVEGRSAEYENFSTIPNRGMRPIAAAVLYLIHHYCATANGIRLSVDMSQSSLSSSSSSSSSPAPSSSVNK